MPEQKIRTIIFNGMEHLKVIKLTDTEKRVISTVKNYLDLSTDEVTLDKAFVNDLGCDSISSIEILMNIEKKFRIEIEDDLFLGSDHDLFTLADIVKIVDVKLEA